MKTSARILIVLLASAYFWHCAATYTQWHFIDSVDLIFHEAGHTIFFFLGTFLNIAAGSGFQIALPLGIALYFFATQQKFSGALCLLWVGQSILNVSVYAADAKLMQLELLGGDGVIHDWNYLLSTLGLLKYTSSIAAIIHGTGIITILTGTFLAAVYTYQDNAHNPLPDSESLPA